jgi:hypothetical protein
MEMIEDGKVRITSKQMRLFAQEKFALERENAELKRKVKMLELALKVRSIEQMDKDIDLDLYA